MLADRDSISASWRDFVFIETLRGNVKAHKQLVEWNQQKVENDQFKVQWRKRNQNILERFKSKLYSNLFCLLYPISCFFIVVVCLGFFGFFLLWIVNMAWLKLWKAMRYYEKLLDQKWQDQSIRNQDAESACNRHKYKFRFNFVKRCRENFCHWFALQRPYVRCWRKKVLLKKVFPIVLKKVIPSTIGQYISHSYLKNILKLVS